MANHLLASLFGSCTKAEEKGALPTGGNRPRPLPLSHGNDRADNLLSLTVTASSDFSRSKPATNGEIEIIDVYGSRFSNTGLPTTEPLELLALANDAVADRDALLACKRINELCQHLSSSWMREPVAKCLARAYILLGDVIPFVSKFPPVDAFFAAIPHDESVQVAVVVEDHRKSELMANFDEEKLDGLDSFPITFYRANPPGSCSREFHAEAVMLSDISGGETFHLQEPRPGGGGGLSNTTPVVLGAAALRRSAGVKLGKTYYARRLDAHVVVVVYFPRSLREKDDVAVEQLLNRLDQLFV